MTGFTTCFQASGTSTHAEEESQITVSVKWAGPDRPQKLKKHLEMLLQTWFNNKKTGRNCSVVRVLGDETFVIKIKPAPGAV